VGSEYLNEKFTFNAEALLVKLLEERRMIEVVFTGLIGSGHGIPFSIRCFSLE
jgi:hypothetical protein